MKQIQIQPNGAKPLDVAPINLLISPGGKYSATVPVLPTGYFTPANLLRAGHRYRLTAGASEIHLYVFRTGPVTLVDMDLLPGAIYEDIYDGTRFGYRLTYAPGDGTALVTGTLFEVPPVADLAAGQFCDGSGEWAFGSGQVGGTYRIIWGASEATLTQSDGTPILSNPGAGVADLFVFPAGGAVLHGTASAMLSTSIFPVTMP